MRHCGEPVEVRHEGQPLQFIWRGRLYDVRGVVAHWLERRPWWREVPDTRAVSVSDLEQEVWRVEAAPGRSGVPGVYDLAVRDHRWQLVRLSD